MNPDLAVKLFDVRKLRESSTYFVNHNTPRVATDTDSKTAVQSLCHSPSPRPSIHNALSEVKAMLDTAKHSTDFTFRHSLITSAIAISDKVCSQIVNPMSPFLPSKTEIETTRDISLNAHSAMAQLLSLENYTIYCETIYIHLHHILRSHGHTVIHTTDNRVLENCHKHEVSGWSADNIVQETFYMIKQIVDRSGWSFLRRFNEWNRIASLIPSEPNFAGLRYWTYWSILRRRTESMQKLFIDGKLEELSSIKTAMDELIKKFVEAADLMANEEIHYFLPRNTTWKTPRYYKTFADGFLVQLGDVRKLLETMEFIRKGDALMVFATEYVKKTDWEYFMFQAGMALDLYRAGYKLVSSCEEINVDVEGNCLWCMARVMGCLGLRQQAHELYLQAVVFAGSMSWRTPSGEWYADAVQQIQIRRRLLEDEESWTRARQRQGIMTSLTIELGQLRCRAERVKCDQTLREFVLWLLQTHGPGGQPFTAPEALSPRETSKVALNVVALYDISKNSEYGERWVVLCEEIIKVQP